MTGRPDRYTYNSEPRSWHPPGRRSILMECHITGRTHLIKIGKLTIPHPTIFICQLPEETQSIIRKDLESYARENGLRLSWDAENNDYTAIAGRFCDIEGIYTDNNETPNGLTEESDIPVYPEPECFQNSQELSMFLGQAIPITDKESDVLFGYMEGHGYALGCREGKLFRGNLCCTKEEGVTWEPYTATDALADVMEWNFQITEETPDEEYEYIERLKEDEKILDALEKKLMASKRPEPRGQ